MNKNNNLIELYRFMFSIFIVIHHTYLLPNAPTTALFPGAYIGVEFFFILSGYLMMASSMKSSQSPSSTNQAFSFVKKKIVAIYPEFILSFLLSFFFVSIQQDISIGTAIGNLVQSSFELLLLPLAGFGVNTYIVTMWYFSALVLGSFIIYPFLKNKYFVYNFAPLIAIFGYGHLYATKNSLATIMDWYGFISSGVLRSLSGLSLGVICFNLVLVLNKIKFTKLGKIFMTIIEIIIVIYFIKTTRLYPYSSRDFLLVLLFFILISSAFSTKSYLSNLFQNSKLVSKLGGYSMSIFITQSVVINFPPSFFPTESSAKVAIYLCYTLILSCLIHFASKILLKSMDILKHIIIKSD